MRIIIKSHIGFDKSLLQSKTYISFFDIHWKLERLDVNIFCIQVILFRILSLKLQIPNQSRNNKLSIKLLSHTFLNDKFLKLQTPEDN